MAGISDCSMSFNRWQKLMAVRILKTVGFARAGAAVVSVVGFSRYSRYQILTSDRVRAKAKHFTQRRDWLVADAWIVACDGGTRRRSASSALQAMRPPSTSAARRQ